MSATIKIHQGTGRLTGESLCLSCSHGEIRHTSTGEQRRCDVFRGYIPGDVQQCSEYYNRSLPRLSSMYEIAWTLVTDKTKKIGFKPPKKSDSMPTEYYD